MSSVQRHWYRLTTALICATAILMPIVVEAAPQTPTLRKTMPAWMGIALAAFLAVVVLAVSIMPSKRGHQD